MELSWRAWAWWADLEKDEGERHPDGIERAELREGTYACAPREEEDSGRKGAAHLVGRREGV